ncbi:MAG TPA: LCP family protein [Solirubrobacteraceae bacterium]|nr:LCP family protein [Solirubrobacteraceae bacterium]
MNAVTSPPPGGGPPADPIRPEPPHRRWWLAKRVLLAGLGVVLLSAGATTVLAVNELDKVVEALGQNRAVKLAPKVLAPTSRGAPETLLLVGDDRRAPPKRNPSGIVLPHSNEMLLVRVDPSKPTISMLSIPRELQVTINPPGAQPVVNRINFAYTLGGIQLMTETIKRVLGLPVNHVFVVTFPKFKRAVDEMGCVYLTVDRRYYHVNEAGGEQYFEINLQPGYQRLCGREALEFVANRHEDTSLTRDARDQRFLLEVKAQYGSTLFENREKFERLLGKAVETDLHGSGPVLDLLELLVQSQGKPVRQVHFQVNLLPTYDTATPKQIHESVQLFLNGTAAISKGKLNAAVRSARPRPRRKGTPTLSLSPTPSSSLAQGRSAAPSLPFALEYPRSRQSFAGSLPDTLRLYDIRDQEGRLHPSYTIVVNSGPLGEFYDVQGTSWTDPPLLSNPSATVHIGSRAYDLFYAGEQLRTVAWREGNATYWVQNTLTNSVAPREMLGIAAQTQPVIGSRPGATPGLAAVTGVNLPSAAKATTSTFKELGALVGLLSFGALVLLAYHLLSRQRELRTLREQVAHAMVLEARQRPLLATAPAGPAARADAVDSGPTIYRAPRRWRRGVLASGLVALVAILVVVGVRLLGSGSSSSTAGAGPVPVAVFNATSTPGAAQAIAVTLKANHLRVGKIGNIKNARLAQGAYVLYPPGDKRQANEVASLIGSLSPTVTPIQPQLQTTLGQHNEIVVLLD